MVLKGLESDEEADAGFDVPGLGQPGLRAGDDGVPQAPGEPRELWSWGIRPMVPDEPRLPSGPGIAAAVHPGLADDLTGAPRPVPTAGPDADLVDVATGDVRLVHEDVRLPVGPGVLPLVIGRVYRSSWRVGRWFGPSWASSFDQRLQSGPERFYAVITDQAGAPAELVSADGTIAGYQQHTLSGGTLWHPAGAATALRSGGRYHDAETGLHCGRRYYDPVTAGYLSPDPLGPDPWPELTGHIGMTAGIADWFSSRDST